MLINPNCLRCGTAFKAELPEWMATATCDRCTGKLLSYVASVPIGEHRRASNRVRAVRRLYGKAEAPTEVPALPCEVDFTPEPAPVYDEVVIISGEGDDPERDEAFRTFLNRQAAIARGNSVPVVPTRIDPMYEAVERGEREARARFLANPNARGFDG